MKRILVVDDEPVNLTLMEERIRGMYPDAEITQASNGAEGMDKFMEGIFDVVVTDFEMPNMNGLELLKFIRSKSKDLRALMISGFVGENQHLLLASVESLGFRFLSKPFRSEELYKIFAEFEK